MHPESCFNGRCVNMDGGFRCECNPGYELDETEAYCIGMWMCYIVKSSIHYVSQVNIRSMWTWSKRNIDC